MDIKIIASGSKGNCYYISDGNSSILLDVGIPLKDIQKGTNFNLSKVVGALVTHQHQDHAKSVTPIALRGIDIYAPADVFDCQKDNSPHFKIVALSDLKSQAIQWHTVGSFKFFAFEVHHDVTNYGYYIHSNVTNENLLYFTDTYYIDYIFPNLHYIMCEANYDIDTLNDNIDNNVLPIAFKKRLVKSHFNFQDLMEFLKATNLNNIKQIHLLHLSDNNSNEQKFKTEVKALTGCEVYVW